jgi:hypothetical protein
MDRIGITSEGKGFKLEWDKGGVQVGLGPEPYSEPGDGPNQNTKLEEGVGQG